jgi:alpha-N-acetylglucosamine transferase
MMLGLQRLRSALVAAIAVTILILIYISTRSHYAAKSSWSSFAYVQYVAKPHYLCNLLMLLESLHRYGSKAERVMLFPTSWTIDDSSDIRYRLLMQAADAYAAKLFPVDVLSVEDGGGDRTWKDSHTKLLAFAQTRYKRVVVLDSDAVLRDVC